MSGAVHTSPPPTLLHEDFLRPTLVFGQSLRLQPAGPWLAVVCGQLLVKINVPEMFFILPQPQIL